MRSFIWALVLLTAACGNVEAAETDPPTDDSQAFETAWQAAGEPVMNTHTGSVANPYRDGTDAR